jgi:hypothetical protein
VPGSAFVCYLVFSVVITWVEFCASYAYSIWFFSRRKMTTDLDQERCWKDSVQYHLGAITLWTFYNIAFRIPKAIFKVISDALKEPEKCKNLLKFIEI